MYLVKFLGFSWDQVHEEAERLEHVTSDEMEERLDRALGFPLVDPHGDPIPAVDGALVQTDYIALTEYASGDVVRVLRVSDDNPQILQHATRLGVGLKKKLTVMQKREFDGSMVVKVGGKGQFISKEVAGAIYVELA
jgi:DtxR family Mn-dependent transcriptional regulator